MWYCTPLNWNGILLFCHVNQHRGQGMLANRQRRNESKGTAHWPYIWQDTSWPAQPSVGHPSQTLRKRGQKGQWVLKLLWVTTMHSHRNTHQSYIKRPLHTTPACCRPHMASSHTVQGKTVHTNKSNSTHMAMLIFMQLQVGFLRWETGV